MAVKPSAEKKKRRCVMASDAEWARIGEAAKAAGLKVSPYLVRASEAWQESAGTTDGGLPPSVLRRLVQAVLVLEGSEKLRFEKQGAEAEAWQGLVAAADAWIDAETALG